jgi:hypothetical protein
MRAGFLFFIGFLPLPMVKVSRDTIDLRSIHKVEQTGGIRASTETYQDAGAIGNESVLRNELAE